MKWNMHLHTYFGAISCFRLTISVQYDNLFLQNVAGGSHPQAKRRVSEIVDLAKPYFQNPKGSLGYDINLNLKEIKHIDNEFRLRTFVACDGECKL